MILQVLCALGIAQQDWQERRKKIADTIESLRDEYRPALREGWLAYIKEMYSSGTSVQQGALKCSSDGMVIDDAEAI